MDLTNHIYIHICVYIHVAIMVKEEIMKLRGHIGRLEGEKWVEEMPICI